MRHRRSLESGLGEPPVKVGVVDIGTNSMRLLITSADQEIGRWEDVTGLGKGVDQTGLLGEKGILRSLEAFVRFGTLMDREGVVVRKAIATSASRDAANRDEFFDRAESALGVRPTLIDGVVEARYAYRGAAGSQGHPGVMVSDIGGGSTEFVTDSDSVSIDIGSVRLTDRVLGPHPVAEERLVAARDHVDGLFATVGLEASSVIGVAGTWTSLSALSQSLDRAEKTGIHGSLLPSVAITDVIRSLAPMSLQDIEEIPSLHPNRAPVILAGAIVAERVLSRLGLGAAKISERDTLDGVAQELLALL